MPFPAVEILIVALLILGNGIFAMSEIALVSARRARLEQMARSGHKGARTALELAVNPNRFLSTVQVGITAVGVLAGAVGAVHLAGPLVDAVSRVAVLEPWAEAIGLTAVVLLVTYATLVLGELVPKQIALSSPERVAAAVAGPMHGLSILASPLVRFLGGSNALVLKLLRVEPADEPPVTHEELTLQIEHGVAAGVFDQAKRGILERVLRLGRRPVRGLMTPRSRIGWMDAGAPGTTWREVAAARRHTRLLICDGALDEVLGYVYARDLLVAETEPSDLTALLHEPLFVPETMGALRLLDAFRETGVHLAVVTDEYGRVAGLATLGDRLVAIVGELPLKDPDAPVRVRGEGEGRWWFDGAAPVDLLVEILDRPVTAAADGVYHTVGGLVIATLGHIPAVGERAEVDGLVLEVVEMEGRRIAGVRVHAGDGAEASSPAA